MAVLDSGLNLSSHLLDLDHDDLRGLERCEADEHVENPEIDVVLGRRLAVALDEISVLRRRALERPLAEQTLHECSDVEPHLGPEWLVVRLEHHPLRTAVETLL